MDMVENGDMLRVGPPKVKTTLRIVRTFTTG
jgi:hypothetical protein